MLDHLRSALRIALSCFMCLNVIIIVSLELICESFFIVRTFATVISKLYSNQANNAKSFDDIWEKFHFKLMH